MRRAWLMVILLAAAAAILPAQASQPAETETVQCYAGQSRAILAQDGRFGQPVGVMTLLLRRTLRPAAQEIVEDLVIAEEGKPVQAFQNILTVSGSDYLLREKLKRYQGHGRLIGPAWEWTGWTLEAILPDGGRITGTFVRQDQGMGASRQLYLADGTLRMFFFEIYSPISPAEFDRRRDELLQPPPAAADKAGLDKCLAELKPVPAADVLGDLAGHTLAGTIQIVPRFPIPQLQRWRRIWIWLPPGYDTSNRRYPVLYMQDGQNVFDRKTSYAGEWQVDETLQRLCQDGKRDGVIVVAVDNGAERRMREYVPAAFSGRPEDEGEHYAEFLALTLKPWIDSHFRTLSDRAHTGVAGSSAGAAISFYIGVKYPEIFSRVGAFSFVITDGYIGQVFQLQAAFPRKPDLPMRFYLHVGTDEAIGGDTPKETFVENLRRLDQELRTMGYGKKEIRLDVEPGGVHNEGDWSRRFPQAFEWLFGESKE
jgi:predicted alpha/beta superfamily hydrolase